MELSWVTPTKDLAYTTGSILHALSTYIKDYLRGDTEGDQAQGGKSCPHSHTGFIAVQIHTGTNESRIPLMVFSGNMSI